MKGNVKSASSKCQKAIDRKTFIKLYYVVILLECGLHWLLYNFLLFMLTCWVHVKSKKIESSRKFTKTQVKENRKILKFYFEAQKLIKIIQWIYNWLGHYSVAVCVFSWTRLSWFWDGIESYWILSLQLRFLGDKSLLARLLRLRKPSLIRKTPQKYSTGIYDQNYV